MNFFTEIFLIVTTLLSAISGQDDLVPNYDFDTYKVISRGKTLTLKCDNQVKSAQQARIEWTYSGGSRNGRLKVNGDTLEIKEASDGDTGKFYCKLEYTPSGGGAAVVVEKHIEVIIEPLLSMKTDLDVSDESQLKLLCQTKAHPQAKIRWEVALIGGGEMTSVDESKGRYNLKVYNGVPNSQLVINQASKDDQGNYTCSATNLAGTVTATALVIISEKGLGIGVGWIAIFTVTTMVTVAAGIGLTAMWQKKRQASQV